MEIFWIVLAVLAGVALLCLLLWLLAMKPRLGGRPDMSGLQGWDYAHRGYYKKDESIPENSLTAFRRAAEKGFGIELDVQLSADGQVMVMHDENLKRMTGLDKNLHERSGRELKKLRLKNTEEEIPLFSEVLEAVAGRVPLIIEVKPYWHTDELCEKTCALLNGYPGVWCVESFQPRIVRWFRENRPELVRGQLMMDFREEHTMSRPVAFLGRNLFSNFWTAPDFIAYRYQDRANCSLRLCKRLYGVQEVSWTLHTQEELSRVKSDGGLGIFEYFDPRSKKAKSPK